MAVAVIFITTKTRHEACIGSILTIWASQLKAVFCRTEQLIATTFAHMKAVPLCIFELSHVAYTAQTMQFLKNYMSRLLPTNDEAQQFVCFDDNRCMMGLQQYLTGFADSTTALQTFPVQIGL